MALAWGLQLGLMCSWVIGRQGQSKHTTSGTGLEPEQLPKDPGSSSASTAALGWTQKNEILNVGEQMSPFGDLRAAEIP